LPRSSAPDAPGSKHTAMLTQFRPTPQPEPGYFYTALCTFHSAPCFNGQQRAGAKGCHSNSHHSGAQALSLPHARMSSASWLGPGQPNQPQGRRPSSGASPYQAEPRRARQGRRRTPCHPRVAACVHSKRGAAQQARCTARPAPSRRRTQRNVRPSAPPVAEPAVAGHGLSARRRCRPAPRRASVIEARAQRAAPLPPSSTPCWPSSKREKPARLAPPVAPILPALSLLLTALASPLMLLPRLRPPRRASCAVQARQRPLSSNTCHEAAGTLHN